MLHSRKKKIALVAHAVVGLALLIAVADLAAAPRRTMRRAAARVPAMRPTADKPAEPMAAMRPGSDTPANGDRPSPDEVLKPEEHVYRPVSLEVRKIVWYDPGQQGLIEAHPLVMGLAAMALATVTLLFFFLRGIKRPKDGDL